MLSLQGFFSGFYLGINFFCKTAEFRRFLLESSWNFSIKHIWCEGRDIFVPPLLKLSHVLAVLQLAWVCTSSQLKGITQSGLAPFLECQGSPSNSGLPPSNLSIYSVVKVWSPLSIGNPPIWPSPPFYIFSKPHVFGKTFPTISPHWPTR